MATWPANGDTDWNTKMLAYLAVGHETDGTHGTVSGFIERGDIGSFDFQVGDFTTDNTWNDLDLTATGVPATVKAVLLGVTVQDGVAGSVMQFRENGNTGTVNVGAIRTQVASVVNDADIMVAMDTNKKIEYRGSNLTFDVINVIVRGWWI